MVLSEQSKDDVFNKEIGLFIFVIRSNCRQLLIHNLRKPTDGSSCSSAFCIVNKNNP